jgi:GH15 family glucan-1,4-alpha-glucosidase
MYPPLADYALIGDCHSAALVSRAGSIDWCCLPRFDADSCFGRLLDWRRGGHFGITATDGQATSRAYLGDSLVLQTQIESPNGRARLLDFFAMRRGGRKRPRRELVRLVEGLSGSVRLRVEFSPRFDFGEVEPWIYAIGPRAWCAVGSNAGLMLYGDVELQRAGEHDLGGDFVVHAGRRLRLGMQFVSPEELHETPDRLHAPEQLTEHLDETLAWWRDWSSKITLRDPDGAPGAGIVRSAITLKALTFAPTGAIVAAPTASLPESVGGARNWDYRFSWVRDSVFTVRALADLGCEAEADGFRRFIQRSAAGSAQGLQVLYGIDGKRRLTEITLDHLEGWRGSRPVRIGNDAYLQFQADMYGLLLELAGRWSERGHAPDEHYWRFLGDMVEAAIARWQQPDRGIWEVRGAPRHFVHSKVMCWAAVRRGLQLAERHGLSAPAARWQVARDEIADSVMAQGLDAERGHFVASFGARDVDAALLLLPEVGFVAYDDPRMCRTTEAIGRELGRDGLILRYAMDDGLPDDEGTFLPCSFWMVECLARQGQREAAQQLFQRACRCANDLGLFAEEASRSGELLGNFPQGLTHLAHIAAARALHETAPASLATARR